MRLVLMTAARQATTEVLPALGLLGHQVRVVAPELSSLLDGDSGDVVLVDARHDLIQARTLCGLLSSTGVAAALVAVLSEGGLVALSADWGVDDVLLDTAGPAEVDARLKWATARRLAAATPADGADGGVTQAGELVIDEHSYSAKLRGRPLDLTYKEFELLKYLAQHPGRVFSRAQLLQEIWGYDYFGGTRTVDVHVRRLRAKLGTEHEALIGTVRNVGYKLDQQVADATAAAARTASPSPRSTPSWSEAALSDHLEPRDVDEVLALLRAATAADGVRPLSEEAELRLQHGGSPTGQDVLVRDGAFLAGYARLDDDVAELVVHPARRRRGFGTAPARPGCSSWPGARPLSIWAHGDLPGFDRAARTPRLHPGPRATADAPGSRRRRPRPAACPARRRPGAALPSRPRRAGVAGGSTHGPSRTTRSRAAGPPRTCSCARTSRGSTRPASSWPGAGIPTTAASCSGRTGRRSTRRATSRDEPVGEVYVLGVDPDAQGLRLGRALTDLGLAHLRARGLGQVLLYVEEDNTAAVRLYEGRGFTRFSVDVLWRRDPL